MGRRRIKKMEDYASEGMVDCFPYLTAINVTTVDFFSLDVEGQESNCVCGLLSFTI
jgi:hypothetical protein